MYVKVDVTKYTEYLKREQEGGVFPQEDPDFWNMLPDISVAICPYCEQEYREKIDLHSLRFWKFRTEGWGGPGSYTHVFYDSDPAQFQHCDHFCETHTFLHLNGAKPDIDDRELKGSLWLRSEAPHVVEPVLEAPADIVAVMNSMPLHKIEQDEFVPRYTLYTISYFGKTEKDRKKLLELTIAHNVKYHKGEFPPRPAVAEQESWWDLNRFVNNRKLGWLENKDGQAALAFAGTGEFPYQGIEGRTEPYWQTEPITIEQMEAEEEEYQRRSAELKEAARQRRLQKKKESG